MVYLASDESSFATGAAFAVDGGMSSRCEPRARAAGERAWGDHEPEPVVVALGPWRFELRGDELADPRLRRLGRSRAASVPSRATATGTRCPTVVESVRRCAPTAAERPRLAMRGLGADVARTSRCAPTRPGSRCGSSPRRTYRVREQPARPRRAAPAGASAGTDLEIGTPDGEVRRTDLPGGRSSPHQPAMDIRSLAWTLRRRRHDRDPFDGDVFEMEDQRNWTDASYKTYSTPLERPFPVVVPDGARHRAVGRARRRRGSRPPPRRMPRRMPPAQRRPELVELRADRPAPAVTLGASTVPDDAWSPHPLPDGVAGPPRRARHPHRLVARGPPPRTTRGRGPPARRAHHRRRSRRGPRRGRGGRGGRSPSRGSACSRPRPRDRAGAVVGAGGCGGPRCSPTRRSSAAPARTSPSSTAGTATCPTACRASRSPSRRRCTRPSGRSSWSRSRSSRGRARRRAHRRRSAAARRSRHAPLPVQCRRDQWAATAELRRWPLATARSSCPARPTRARPRRPSPPGRSRSTRRSPRDRGRRGRRRWTTSRHRAPRHPRRQRPVPRRVRDRGHRRAPRRVPARAAVGRPRGRARGRRRMARWFVARARRESGGQRRGRSPCATPVGITISRSGPTRWSRSTRATFDHTLERRPCAAHAGAAQAVTGRSGRVRPRPVATPPGAASVRAGGREPGRAVAMWVAIAEAAASGRVAASA